MIISETFFYRGQAVGQILQNTNSSRVTFQPVEGHTRLACRKWRNVNTCQRAVLKTYQQEIPPNTGNINLLYADTGASLHLVAQMQSVLQ